MAACRIPLMPSPAAPMASGPTDGAKVAAVPVVPYRKGALRGCRWGRFASQCLQYPYCDSPCVFQALRGAFEARACHRSFEEEAEVFGPLQRLGFGGHGFQVLSEKPLHLFLVRGRTSVQGVLPGTRRLR